MVDSRPVYPDMVIDMASRKRRRPNASDQKQEPAARPLPMGAFPLTKPFLQERLTDPNEQVRMWAAFQLVERWQDHAEQYVERMWNAGRPEIVESAIHLVAKYRLHQFAFPVLRVFDSEDSGLRNAAALALGQLHYEPAVKPLHEWSESIFATPEVNLLELEAAVKSLLLLDNWRYWDLFHARLQENQQNHSVFSVLFNALALEADNEEQAERISRSYRVPREIFHDYHLAQNLTDVFGRPGLNRYIQARLNGGYTLPTVYQEAIRAMGFDATTPELRALIEQLGECDKTQQGLEKFLPVAQALIDQLAPNEAESPQLKAFLRGSAAWIKDWEEAILKVREVEYHMLVSLPLVAVLARAERECLEDPVGEVERMSAIYQSPLLSPPFMTQVINLLTSLEGGPIIARLGNGPLSGWLRDEEKDGIWKLVTGQLSDVDYPFEQVLPQPWEFRNPEILEKLAALLAQRFPHYVTQARQEAVDYSLEVFRRVGTPDLVMLVNNHFDALFSRHNAGFMDFINHVPDHRFLEPLLGYFREDELELGNLITFLCDVHRIPWPKVLRDTKEVEGEKRVSAMVRLKCTTCESTFQYKLESLYVNEECVEQRQIPQPKDLWSPTTFACKQCGDEIPFEPEPLYLQELYAELLAARMLHLTNPEESRLNHIHLIPFPVLWGKTCNPNRFLREVESTLAQKDEPAEQVPYLMELGKFYLEVGKLSEAKQAFQKVQAGPVNYPLTLYYLGIIAFQEKNPYEARVYFSRLVSTSEREEFKIEVDNPVDMAQHYLKLLEKRDFMRSHFRLVTT